MELNLSDNLDLTDIGVYPLTVNTLRLDMGASAKGQAFEILVPGFEAVYSAGGGSVAGIEAAQGVRGLQAGMYLVRVTTTNGVSTAKLIVK